MTKPKRYKRYSSEFKKEAIRRATEEGITDKAVCDELGVSTRQFRRWRDELHLFKANTTNIPKNKIIEYLITAKGIYTARKAAA